MSTGEITAIRTEAIRLYGLSPSVTLSVVTSGGNLGTINDTRLQAGVGSTSPTAFPSIAVTQDVSTVTVGFSRINKAHDTSENPWTDATHSYPLYFDAGDLREMTETDFADTFVLPAIDTLTTGSTGTAQAGTFFISTATTVAGATRVSATPVFADTRANAAAYTSSGLPETRDQPTTILNYFLYRVNSASAAGHQLPICFTKSGTNLQQTPSATFTTALQTMIRYYAAEITGTKIDYNINGTGNNRGTAMVDTKLNSSSYLTRFVNADDYRAQEVPSGSATTINTSNLKITQV